MNPESQPEETLRQKLEASESRYRRLFESAKEGILIFDATTGLITAANPYLAELLDFSPEDLLGRKPWEIGLFDDRSPPEAARPELPAQGDFHYDSLILKTKTGRQIEVELFGNVHGADHEKVVQCNIRDVTLRKREEQDIRKLSRAVEQSPVSVVITDPSGNIEYVNRKCCELTGYRREELLGMNPRVLKSGEIPPEVYRQLWQTIIAGSEWRGEFHNRKKDGELYWENASISAIRDDTGRITHFLAVKEDITRQKLLEDQLRQAQKMEAVGQLAGGVAHGFNNILTSTLMQLGLLLDDPNLTEGTRISLKQLESEAQRAADLARQLLTFSRRQVIQRKPADLNKVLAGLGKTLQQLMGERVTIEFASGNIPLWIEADVRMIEQVVTNLSVNARDAMTPNGGRLTIDAKLVELDAAAAQANPEARPGLFVCLSVADTGRGMDERTLKHTFEPFFTTKEVGKGMGLGLATVHGIAKQHEGWVEATSQVRHGSVFRVFLPALITTAPPKSEAVAEKAPQGKELILLVEDEQAVREMVALGLQLFGYRVLEASNGPEALKIWEKQAAEIDLLFTDMRMPGMTGMELYERLKRGRANLKAVLSSGYSEEILKLDRITDQGIIFLPKPYNIKTLAVTVRNCLDQA